jgi:predicted HTH domain antitoxin
MLYQKNKLTLSQASHLADMSILRFQHLLASRQIPINYDEDDLNQDLKALEELGRL